jgi:hypothetical protein
VDSFPAPHHPGKAGAQSLVPTATLREALCRRHCGHQGCFASDAAAVLSYDGPTWGIRQALGKGQVYLSVPASNSDETGLSNRSTSLRLMRELKNLWRGKTLYGSLQLLSS